MLEVGVVGGSRPQTSLRPTSLDIATALETLEQLHWKRYLVENCHFIEKPIAAPPHNDRFSDLVTWSDIVATSNVINIQNHPSVLI